MTFSTQFHRWFTLLMVSLAVILFTTDFVEARRGGSFGSRGSRTWMSPAPTQTAPQKAPPIDRSMTPRPTPNQPGMAQTPAGGQRGGFGGLGGGLLGGLLFGGLLGWMFGSGFGGAAGLLGMILQLGLIALLAMFLIRAFAGWSTRASLAGGGAGPSPMSYSGSVQENRYGSQQPRDLRPSSIGGNPNDAIGITSSDLDRFEQLLGEIQTAFGREDFAGLRSRTTPEVMSYLAEELGQNGARGIRNEVSDVKLLQGDLSESWREDNNDYATVAMRYQSRDVMRDRISGKVTEGDPDHPTEATELWTFARNRNGDWRLSAVQEIQET
jgi:predicted lipid-binding transport protein (Tim44 family)